MQEDAQVANLYHRGMQECFRQYPEIYGAELADDDAEGDFPEQNADVPAVQRSSESAPESTTQKVVEEASPVVDATSANKEIEAEPTKETAVVEAVNGDVSARPEDATGANKVSEEKKDEVKATDA